MIKIEFELTVKKSFADLPPPNYINDCCIGGDKILKLFKFELLSQMNIDDNLIEIYQEDWGWGLEFLKDNITYLLAISNLNLSETVETTFNGYVRTTKKEKGVFINKTVNVENELSNFFKIVISIAEKKDFIVNQNEI